MKEFAKKIIDKNTKFIEQQFHVPATDLLFAWYNTADNHLKNLVDVAQTYINADAKCHAQKTNTPINEVLKDIKITLDEIIDELNQSKNIFPPIPVASFTYKKIANMFHIIGKITDISPCEIRRCKDNNDLWNMKIKVLYEINPAEIKSKIINLWGNTAKEFEHTFAVGDVIYADGTVKSEVCNGGWIDVLAVHTISMLQKYKTNNNSHR